VPVAADLAGGIYTIERGPSMRSSVEIPLGHVKTGRSRNSH
jgi:hypothetical protein